MAKIWSPTQKQYSEYERLLKRYNKIRNKIKKVHRYFSDADEGGRVPALVLPERHRKMTMQQIRISGRKLFQLKLKQLRSVVSGGMKSFYKSYKASYLELYRTYIIQESPEYTPFNNGAPFLYSDMQIKEMAIDDPKMGQFMNDYNDIVRMSPEIFAYLLKSGKIPAFKAIYADLVGSGTNATFYESFADVMHQFVRMVRGVSSKAFKSLLEGNFTDKNIREIESAMNRTHKGIVRFDKTHEK